MTPMLFSARANHLYLVARRMFSERELAQTSNLGNHMNDFEYQLNQEVQLTLSAEKGVVIGRAEYSTGTKAYLVRYVAADGRQAEVWWDEAAITEA